MLLVLLQLEHIGFYQSCLLHGPQPPNNLGRGLAQKCYQVMIVLNWHALSFPTTRPGRLLSKLSSSWVSATQQLCNWFNSECYQLKIVLS